MQKVRDHIMLLAQAVFVLCIFLILANFQPLQREYSQIPVKGDAGVVDYAEVTNIVQSQLESLHIPKDGKTGERGPKGDPADPVDYTTINAFIEQKIQEALDARGNPSQPELDLEYDGNKWRLVGDDSWQTCTPEDNCP